MTSRRSFLAVSGLLLSGSGLLNATAAHAQTVNMADVLVPGTLGDQVLGSADAKVTMVEYASLTCSHCGRFHNETWPAFRAKYVDTGKVRYILREFPLDPLAMAGSMLVRCAPEERRWPLVDLLFKQQANWAFTNRPLDNLLGMVRQAGFTQESFESCLKRTDLYDALNQTKDRGAEKFGVNSTPTFIINGQVHRGALTLQELDRILGPLVGA
jgi:protein-disulfide isomerase